MRVGSFLSVSFSFNWIRSDQISRSSCLTLCDPMNRSTPGLPVHHQLPEFTESHVHQVIDAIQPSHPLSSPSPPAPNPSQHQGFFNESTLRMRWPKYWSFSFNIIPSKEIPRLISLQSILKEISPGISLEGMMLKLKLQYFGHLMRRVFSNESTLRIRLPKYWSFSFSIIPSKEIPGLIFRLDWLDLLAVQNITINID